MNKKATKGLIFLFSFELLKFRAVRIERVNLDDSFRSSGGWREVSVCAELGLVLLEEFSHGVLDLEAGLALIAELEEGLAEHGRESLGWSDLHNTEDAFAHEGVLGVDPLDG